MIGGVGVTVAGREVAATVIEAEGVSLCGKVVAGGSI
jgi:hypothetical protein